MAKIKTSVKTRLEYLRRLSIVWASPLSLKIVTELYLREMSPKGFHAEFGGGSLSRIDKTFKKLAKHRWLRYVHSKGPGGHRRGATEHFYRATELAIFDEETWALVPYSMRVAISWMTFKQLAERVRDALKAKTLTANAGTHLDYMTIALDELGWGRVVAAVNAFFESVFEEQEDAKIRVSHTGEKSRLTTVGLAVFESVLPQPRGGRKRHTPRLLFAGKECPVPFTLRVSKAIADEVCLRIIEEANWRAISAPLFHTEIGGDSIEGIRRRFKMMERVGWLKQAERKTGGKRRSAVEIFYRAAGPAILGEESWAELPASTKTVPATWTTFLRLAEQIKEAIVAGTFEARIDSHFTWSLLRLDREGWEKLTAALDELLTFIFAECQAAEERLDSSGESPITTTIALIAFESPVSTTKEP